MHTKRIRIFGNLEAPFETLCNNSFTLPAKHTRVGSLSSTYLPTYLPTYLLTYLPTYLTYLPTYLRIFTHFHRMTIYFPDMYSKALLLTLHLVNILNTVSGTPIHCA